MFVSHEWSSIFCLSYTLANCKLGWNINKFIWDTPLLKNSLKLLLNIGICMSYINSTINPFVYMACNSTYRSAYLKAFGIKRSEWTPGSLKHMNFYNTFDDLSCVCNKVISTFFCFVLQEMPFCVQIFFIIIIIVFTHLISFIK